MSWRVDPFTDTITTCLVIGLPANSRVDRFNPFTYYYYYFLKKKNQNSKSVIVFKKFGSCRVNMTRLFNRVGFGLAKSGWWVKRVDLNSTRQPELPTLDSG
jgi:hypothetical protein